ncbi:serine/threonine-protein kinase mos-like [Argiope bruennichi]|uniref:non-specific serine/threonine protein kinase n=1 Tax=Argiope bruennichi TaxID=94029 RepID=A0A8T0FW88_ARGBR|nr:serine/threonine-protein kinase mos-like [Argiope bruennichi]XP_055930959.1 serine/threonine-protein kinase mos-like [Argiope bruennichi]XP_055930960.1 serine/threonine-protein kinase mos-like [Argiope bruennichi]XP_055930961.1 serine/threonine-protein kinase mos-like [Argiope bruennichi]KAF8795384.1 Serine/threonine-protein kinase mos like protein [Argiope bruennichi]
MDPVLTLSPSPSHSSLAEGSPNAYRSPQTTPKLPRRERLASFSRLMASENFMDLLPSKSNGSKRRINLRGRKFEMENLPTIHVSPSSPAKNNMKAKKIIDGTFLQNIGNGCFKSPQLPFSPCLLNKKSPMNLSPNYQNPTPTKSPLYRLDRKNGFLGRGSFGNVTLCVYKDSKFAMKVTHHTSPFVGERNFLEIRHPHLVSILHISEVSDKTFIFMEFAGNCNLQQVLDTKSELDFLRKVSFCIQVLSGLRYCHRNRIVHADVKPANVIVSPHGVCKLGDFGHSFNMDAATQDSRVFPPHDIVGTAAYAAPEVLRGSRPTTFSDIYSFGVLLWQVYSREIPFGGEHPHIVIYKVANYGARPKFAFTDEVFARHFSRVAELCWQEEPNERLEPSQALRMLQELAQQLKQCQVH